MALAPGTKLGSYEVIGSLGAGGMGEVYRARDARLGRDVAVKVLPDSFAHDPDRLARFQREAQVLASLNHPNIATIHGFEDAREGKALVMELVEGPTLADRIAEGPLALDDALLIAKQIIDALDVAHAQGVVHRDLKPANIKIRPDGAVKVLDFGLAKAVAPEGASGVSEAMNSPTLTARATQMGIIIGTAAYMAPEQARGKAVDRRADIWAFGCVLYEMVTGKRLFVGEDLTETLASVVKENPTLERAPPGLQRLLRKCLEKDPKRRLRDIGDAWDLIDVGTPSVAPAAVAPMGKTSRLAWGLAALATVAAVVLAILYVRPAAVDAPSRAQFHLAWPVESGAAAIGGAQFFQISPNGRHIAIVSHNALWVRALDAVEPIRFDRTQGSSYPFWSPDGEHVAFFQGGQLKTIARSGGSPRTICDAPEARGGAWSSRGTIVFAATFGSNGLSQVSEQGGTPKSLTTLAGRGVSDDAHRYPQFLPDGNRFLYLHLASRPEVAGVYVASLDGTPPVRVLDGSNNAIFTRSGSTGSRGHLLFIRGSTLMAQVFDAGAIATSGTPFVVATGVGQGENTGVGAFSVADDGTLAHAEGITLVFDLKWIARSGAAGDVLATETPAHTFAVAPDQKRVAMGLIADGMGLSFDIWIQPIGASPSRFTFGPAPGWIFPQWSPKGDQIAYATVDLAGQATYEIRRKPSNMAGVDEKLVSSTESIYLWDWSPDGKFLLYSTGGDLYMLPLEGDRKPVAFTKTPADEEYAQVSPNGRWMVYTSGPRGATQVFVQPIPATGAFWQVSQGMGDMPRWRADGKELFYRAGDGKLMAVAVTAVETGAFSFSTTHQALFPIPSLGNVERYTYEPSPDGSKFLVSVPAAGASRPITVMLNWRGK